MMQGHHELSVMHKEIKIAIISRLKGMKSLDDYSQ